MKDLESSIGRLAEAEKNPMSDHASALFEFKNKRRDNLLERLAEEGFGVCGEVHLHRSFEQDGKTRSQNLQRMGVFPSDKLKTVEIEFETYSYTKSGANPKSPEHLPNASHSNLKIVRKVCPGHSNKDSLPRSGLIDMVEVDDANAEVDGVIEIPENIYRAFDLPTLPVSQS